MSWATNVRSAGMTTLRRARAARGGAAVLLTYHRVVDTEFDPQRLAVSTATFAEHVAALASRFTLMAAGDVFTHIAEQRALPRNAVAITLDDGYTDALTHARPILEAVGAPATVFACSGYLAGDREFWWDELERVVLLGDELPARLELSAAGSTFARTLEAGRGLHASERHAFAGWDFTMPATHPRQRLYLDLCAFIEPLGPADREHALSQLAEQTGATRGAAPDKRALREEELPQLESGGLIEVGAHTINHVRLAGLTLAEQREEIAGCKRELEAVLGHEIRSFSYPYGTAAALTGESVRLVRDSGFVGACTTQLGSRLPWGSASLRTDPFQVPRTATAEMPARELVALVDKRLGL